MIRVLLSDDHAMLRDGLKLVLQTDAQFEIVGEADNGEDAILLVEQLKPDLVILDINMPKVNGIEAARIIKAQNPRIKILMLTMHENESYIMDAVSSGVDGYIFKMCDMDEFLKASRTVAEGKKYFHENVTRAILSNYVNKAKNESQSEEKKSTGITRREMEVLNLIAEGKTSQEISEKLYISYFTVGKHRKNIMHKFDLKNTAELIKFAIKTRSENQNSLK
ncbi:MAG: response regulator [Clostridiales bacterium]